ncbi:hypothetical protein MYMAC_000230 [Corallococcus macrosporus DSM 14697]|uniref:Protein kinase domain-containing protein n=2 Tax=Corallococcus macrosporus TaxID=35 RepID=A0A250JLA0_9BACT|nr:hypothetical protein MYMAC_000230 [Corallococcus macrosporus DSM 14697]
MSSPARRGRRAGRGSAMERGLEQLSLELARAGFSAGPIGFRFVRPLEARGNGAEVLLFERSLHDGPPGMVVVKRLRNPSSFLMRQRLKEEVLLALRLHHPAIAQVHHFRIIGRAPHAILEYVAGPSLDALITLAMMRGQPLPTAFVLYVAAEVADALQHAHTLTDASGRPLGIIHRDVSPRNIRVERATGQVKVTDFGAAYSKRVGREETPEKLLKGDLMYASPEYLLGAPMDARSDLYSLGLLLLEALTHHHLFNDGWEGATHTEPDLRADEPPDVPLPCLLAFMKRCTPENVERATAPLSPGLQALLRRMLAKPPSDRPSSADEVCLTLRARLQELAPGYDRRRAAEDMAQVIVEASAARVLGEPVEGGIYPVGLDMHELMPISTKDAR